MWGVDREYRVSADNVGVSAENAWGCRQRMPGGVGIEYRGVGRECVGVSRECVVVSAANVGCRQRIWGVGRECGVSVEDVGCRQRMPVGGKPNLHWGLRHVHTGRTRKPVNHRGQSQPSCVLSKPTTADYLASPHNQP